MLLVVVALAVGTAAGLLLGGRVRHLAGTRLRSVGLLLGGAVCELAGNRWDAGTVGTGIIVAGYLLLLAFAAHNAAITGMVLVAAGLLANALVIAIDNGMPVRGAPPGATFGARHHGERPGDHLSGLADVIHAPLVGETVSAGDLVLSLGMATVVVSLLRPPRRRLALNR
jgi:hypothetical protein